MMTRRQLLKATGAGTVLAGLGGAPFSRPARAQASKLVIGGSVPMSGAAAETGLNVLNGYRCAAKFINEELGGFEIGGKTYTIDLQLFDDASDPARATSLIQRQVDEGVGFFLGSFGSNIVLPTCSITEAAGRVMVQAGGGSDLIFTQGRRMIFGLFPRASRQFVSSIELFKRLDNPPARTVSLIYTNDPFSKFQATGAEEQIKKAGMQVLEMIELPAQVSDVSTVLANIRRNPPDILVCNTHDEISMLIARQMVSSDTNVNMLYQTLGPQTEAYKQALKGYADTVVTQAYWTEYANYTGERFGTPGDFAAYYRANFDRSLTYHVASGAACIVSYIEAMRSAGSIDPIDVRDALAALDFESFYGRIRFTEDGDGDPELLGPLLIQRQDGEMRVIHPESAANASPVWPAPSWAQRA